MKIVIGQIAHETNTFSTVKTTTKLFKHWEWDRENAIIQKHRQIEDYLGGMISRGEELQIDILPAFSAFANPSGKITTKTYLELKAELIKHIKKLGIFDAICLMLHGAGVTEEIDDLEGHLLQELRKEFGYKIPINVVLDLHANLSRAMVEETNLIIGDNLYPHVDSFERGKELIDLTYQMLRKEIHPAMHLEKLPLLIPTSTTDHFPASYINGLCRAREKDTRILDCTFYHGFPYSDTEDTSVSVLTITNNNPQLAESTSKEIANEIWSLRQCFMKEYPGPNDALDHALHEERYPVVMNETSDNPGAGTPGDGTRLLKAMLEKNIPKSCFGVIYDPEVAEKAHQAGEGSTIDVMLGGKCDYLHGEPLQINAYVKKVTDGRFIQTSPMWKGIQVDLGKSARLQVGKLDIIVSSINTQVMDEQVFVLHDINIEEYDIIAIKSSHHFRAAFESISYKIITVDSPGLSTYDLKFYHYEKIKRPIYPFVN